MANIRHHFERYCKDYENIENYEKAKKDNFKGWHCHHRKGVDISVAELQALDMYYNRPSEELIFMKHSEHSSLHTPSDDVKNKMSEAKKGENNPMYGKHHTDEARGKMSEVHKGKPTWSKGKHLSEEAKKKMREAHKNMSEETKKKLSEAAKGTHWFNNGKICIRAKECPEGFTPGRLR